MINVICVQLEVGMSNQEMAARNVTVIELVLLVMNVISRLASVNANLVLVEGHVINVMLDIMISLKKVAKVCE